MNYLAHLYLAQRTGTSAAGALLGDFVRGRLAGGLPADVETGIRLHRRVDTYTDSHPEVVAARRSFDPPLRRYAGILIDLYFDHILACRWPQWHPDPLPEFAADCAARLRAAWPTGAPFPVSRLHGLAGVLAGYRQPDGIQRALERIDARLSRPSPLSAALPYLQTRSGALGTAFERFFPELIEFSVAEAGCC